MMQEDINRFLTQRMEEDKVSVVQGDIRQFKNKTATSEEEMAEENYGEDPENEDG